MEDDTIECSRLPAVSGDPVFATPKEHTVHGRTIDDRLAQRWPEPDLSNGVSR